VVVVSDSVTIKVTDGPVKIGLMANPDIIKSNSTDCSTITVSLQNAAGFTLKKDNLISNVEITFSVFGDFDEGDLSNSTIIITPGSSAENAVGTTTLCPTSKRGLANVMATATDLESNTVDVRFLGPPDSISISANPNTIYVDDIEGSTVTVSLIDENGFITNPISGYITVSLALSTDPNDPLADLVPHSLDFSSTDPIGDSKITIFKYQSSASTANITASAEGLSDNSVTINILSALVPDHIELTASSQNVAVGGTISTITATVYDGSEKVVTNYGELIYFETTWGAFTGATTTTTINGIATIELSSDSEGTATVTATASLPGVTPGSVEVGFYSTPDHIKLTTSHETVKADGVSTSTITATVYDNVEENNIIVTNYAGTITFVTTLGAFTGATTTTTTNGIATIELSSDSEGTATVTATASLSGVTPGSVEVGFYEEINLTLVDDSVICSPTCDIVTFDVIVAGDDIEVDEMKIIWSESGSQERLSKIVIGEDEVEVYTGSAKSGTIVDISNKTLEPGEHSIELTFIQDMAGRQIDVMFYPLDEGWYLIRFNVPEAL
jgi:adhesin/invasin